MKRYFWHVLVAIALTGCIFGQSPAIKPSPASESLVSTAKEMTEAKKSLDTAMQQARSALDSSQKQLTDKYAAVQKDLTDQLRKDKKYAPIMAQLDTLTKQVKDAQGNAEQQFGKTAGPLQQKVATDNALIQGLIPIVRKENGLPDTATFNPETQTWTAK